MSAIYPFHYCSNERYKMSVIIALFAFIFFISFSSYPFYSTGEPREAVVAQSMIINNDLLHSVRYGSELATKPPMAHWLMVLSSKITGEMNALTSRIPSIVSSTFIVFIWSFFLLPRIGRKRTLFAIGILLISFEWMRHATLARVDMLLSACLLASLLLLYHSIESNNKKYYVFLSIIPLSLAALTKGPIGIALPLLVVFFFLLNNKKVNLKEIMILACIGLISALPLFYWYFLQSSRVGGDFFQIVFRENLGRLFSTMNLGKDPHSHGLAYLPAVSFLGLLPGSLFLLFTIRKTSFSFPKLYQKFLNADSYIKFSIVTSLIFFIFFLIPSSKRSVYLLPIYPMVTLLLALAIEKRMSSVKKSIHIVISILTILWTLIFLIVLFDLSSLPLDEKVLFQVSLYQNLLINSFRDFLPYSVLFLALPLIVFLILISADKKADKKFSLVYTFPIYFIAFFISIKVLFVNPYARTMSPMHFVQSKIKEHNPISVSLSSGRMFGVLFYARMENPKLIVNNFSKDSKNVFSWSDEDEQIKDDLHVYVSKTPVKKITKRLKYTRSLQ